MSSGRSEEFKRFLSSTVADMEASLAGLGPKPKTNQSITTIEGNLVVVGAAGARALDALTIGTVKGSVFLLGDATPEVLASLLSARYSKV